MENKIDITELKDEGSDVIKELATFLEERTRAEVKTGANELIIKSEEANVSRAYLRVLLKKFLYQKELKEYFRVIGGKENSLVIKGKKAPEEE